MSRPLPLSSVRVTDPYWAEWQHKLIHQTLGQQLEQLEGTGRLENFRRAARGETSGFEGYRFNDSDVYKWLEAGAYALQLSSDAKAQPWSGALDEVIDLLARAQMPDGYLNTYFQLGRIEQRWKNLNAMHEMYCGGHLIEAGVAHFEATGKRTLLDVAVKWADHLLAVFGPTGRPGTDGHPEVELALLRLAAALHEPKYREAAIWHLKQRGRRPSPYQAELEDPETYGMAKAAGDLLLENGQYSGEYAQDHTTIENQTQVVGHAVRAMYLYAAATEVRSELDSGTSEALNAIWANLTGRRMYVTGGAGPAGRNEGFTKDFDLPNLDAYAETCASIGLVRWAQKWVEATGDAAYADVLERALYNGCMSGISQTGTLYSYTNPLESRGNHHRVPWYACACCPPNIARTIGEVARFALAGDSGDIYLNLPISLETDRLSITGDYLATGKIRIEIKGAGRFNLHVRIPDWCGDCGIEVAGDDQPAEFANGYAVIDREWKAGDQVSVDFELLPRWVEADPRVLDNIAKVALQRGPLVYCFEDANDLPQRFRVDLQAEPQVQSDGTILVEGFVTETEAETGELYAEFPSTIERPYRARFIPFAQAHNEGPRFMAVWMRY